MKRKQKNKKVNESLKKRVTVKEVRTWMKTLEENKWRKTYNVDARRVAHFCNFGESIDLPKSLQRKNNSNTYIREKKLAREFIKSLNNKLDNKSLREFIREEIRGLMNG